MTRGAIRKTHPTDIRAVQDALRAGRVIHLSHFHFSLDELLYTPMTMDTGTVATVATGTGRAVARQQQPNLGLLYY